MLSKIKNKLLALTVFSLIPLINAALIFSSSFNIASSFEVEELALNLGFTPVLKIGKEILASCLFALSNNFTR